MVSIGEVSGKLDKFSEAAGIVKKMISEGCSQDELLSKITAMYEGRFDDVIKSPTSNVAAGDVKTPEELAAAPTKS